MYADLEALLDYDDCKLLGMYEMIMKLRNFKF